MFQYVDARHQTGYYVINPEICPLRECVPRQVIDPENLWEIFPCPPPWKPELLLELNWEGRLGEEGTRIKHRVASRCGINIQQLKTSMLESSGQSLFFLDCNINCFVPILAGITCAVFLLVAFVAFVIKRFVVFILHLFLLGVGWGGGANKSHNKQK